eukprot:817596-Pleurochrysis_carterae.AAC.2
MSVEGRTPRPDERRRTYYQLLSNDMSAGPRHGRLKVCAKDRATISYFQRPCKRTACRELSARTHSQLCLPVRAPVLPFLSPAFAQFTLLLRPTPLPFDS